MSDTFYKVNYIINGKIDTIYVFYGKPVTANKKKTVLTCLVFCTKYEQIYTVNLALAPFLCKKL